MKTALDAILLVRRLRLEGVSIVPNDDGTIWVSHGSLLTADDRELLIAHKTDVVAYLRKHILGLLPDDETIRRWQAEARRQTEDKG